MKIVVITDANIMIKLAVMFMSDANVNLNKLTNVRIYLPVFTMNEIIGLKRIKEKHRILDAIAWITQNVERSVEFVSLSEIELRDELKKYEKLYESLLGTKIQYKLSSCVGIKDVRLLSLAQNNDAYLATDEGTLYYFSSIYYDEQKTWRLFDILKSMLDAKDVTSEQVESGVIKLKNVGENLRRDDELKLNQYLKSILEDQNRHDLPKDG